MEFTSSLEGSFSEKLAIGAGSASGSTRGSDVRAAAATLSRKSGSGPNFSYPRVEGRPSRHEPSNSRSSVTSSNSVPGMTDSSDSDASLDDDYCQYNASASELWDRFWPSADGKATNSRERQETTVNKQPSRATSGYFSFDLIKHYTDEAEDDTITLSPLENKAEGATAEETQSPPASPRSPPRRPNSKRAAATYSVYPKPQLLPPPRLPHPPRTSSLNTQQQQQQPLPPSPPRKQQQQRRRLKGSKSTHNLYISPPILLPSLPSSRSAGHIATSSISISNATARSVPVSPAYPPPPPPRSLRPSVSAASLRDKLFNIGTSAPAITASGNSSSSSSSSDGLENARRNATATAPLRPLALRAVPPNPNPNPNPSPSQPQSEQQRFVSVFELDSDAESIAENGGGVGGGGSGGSSGSSGANKFARRLLMSSRSLHKKSASEKKRNGSAGGAPMPIVITAASAVAATPSSSAVSSPVLPDFCGAELARGKENEERERERGKEKEKGSPSRKRGGSLGRILGFKGR